MWRPQNPDNLLHPRPYDPLPPSSTQTHTHAHTHAHFQLASSATGCRATTAEETLHRSFFLAPRVFTAWKVAGPWMSCFSFLVILQQMLASSLQAWKTSDLKDQMRIFSWTLMEETSTKLTGVIFCCGWNDRSRIYFQVTCVHLQDNLVFYARRKMVRGAETTQHCITLSYFLFLSCCFFSYRDSVFLTM